MKKEELDLETLEWVKFMFDVHSDHSTRTNGYQTLCETIEELKQNK